MENIIEYLYQFRCLFYWTWSKKVLSFLNPEPTAHTHLFHLLYKKKVKHTLFKCLKNEKWNIRIYYHRAKLEKITIRNNLTNMYNMSKFKRVLKYEISIASIRSFDLSISNINMDKSKSVNYIYGHLIGDKVINSTYKCSKRSHKKRYISKMERRWICNTCTVNRIKKCYKNWRSSSFLK